VPFSSADPNAYVGLGMQSGLGAPQTTASKFRFSKYLSGTDFGPELDNVQLREGGDGLDIGVQYKRSQKTSGQIVMNVRPEFGGQLLSVLPAGATWNGGSPGAAASCVHTFAPVGASYPWSTMQIAFPGTSLIQILSDVRFREINLEMNAGDPLKITAPFTAINQGASVVAIAPTYGASQPDDFFLPYHAPTYVIDGAAATGFIGFKLNHTLGVEELQAAPGLTLDEIIVQNRDSDLEFTRRYEDPALYKKIYFNGGVSPTTAIATGSFEAAQVYGSGVGLKKLRLVVPLMTYGANKLTELDPDGKTIIETVSAQILKTATTAWFIELTNAHASAYIS
jgi:hypothetical protein